IPLASRTSMALQFDPGILGEQFDRTEHQPVTADELLAFARALGENSPCYVEPGAALVGHPTYCIRFRPEILPGQPAGWPADADELRRGQGNRVRRPLRAR